MIPVVRDVNPVVRDAIRVAHNSGNFLLRGTVCLCLMSSVEHFIVNRKVWKNMCKLIIIVTKRSGEVANLQLVIFVLLKQKG